MYTLQLQLVSTFNELAELVSLGHSSPYLEYPDRDDVEHITDILEQGGRHFYRVDVDGETAGFLDFDVEPVAGEVYVALFVREQYRGVGVGSAMIALGRELYPTYEFVAQVDMANTASVKLFTKFAEPEITHTDAVFSF